MMRSDEFRKQVNELWKQAVDQLEEVKEAIVRSTGRIENDLQRLRLERDRLLKRLGEQTHKLASQGRLPMPAFIKATVDRLNLVIDKLVAKQGSGRRRPKRGTAKKKTGAKRSGRSKRTGVSTPASAS